MKRLLSLNLAIILVLSLFVFPVYATSSPVYSITVDGVTFNSNENKSGEGWSYSASVKRLSLIGYNGSTIKASGDLVIYATEGVTITGTQCEKYSQDSCGIYVSGTLDFYTTGITTISGADSTEGKGGEGIIALNATVRSHYGSKLTVIGGNKASGIKADNLVLATKDATIKGGKVAGIYFSSSIKVEKYTTAIIDSCAKSGSTYAVTHLVGAAISLPSEDEMDIYSDDARHNKIIYFKNLLSVTSEDAFLYGDFFADGLINVKDAVRLAQYLAGWNLTTSPQELEAADVQKDDNINVTDAVKLAQYLAGWSGIVLGKK